MTIGARAGLVGFAVAGATAIGAVACSLDGLSGGQGGEGAITTGAGSTEVGSSGPGTGSSNSTSSGGGGGTASSSGGGSGGGSGGATSSSGGGGSGGDPAPSLFTWVEHRGTPAKETLEDDEGAAALAALGDDRAVFATVSGVSADVDEVILALVRDVDGVPTLLAEERLRWTYDDPTESVRVTSLVARPDGVAIALEFRGTLETGFASTFTAAGEDGIALHYPIALDAFQAPTAIQLGGSSSQGIGALTYLPDGDLLVSGRYTPPFTLDCGPGALASGTPGFVARFDAGSGECVGAVHFANLGPSFQAHGVRTLSPSATDADLVFAAGSFGASLTLAGETFDTTNARALLFGLSTAGEGVAIVPGSAATFGASSGSHIAKVSAALPDGGFVVGGTAAGTAVATLCPTLDVPAGTLHAFVARIDADGGCSWARAWDTGLSSASTRGIAADPAGSIVVSGVFAAMDPCAEVSWSGEAPNGFALVLDAATGRPTHGLALLGANDGRGVNEQVVGGVAAPGSARSPLLVGSYGGRLDPGLPTADSSDLFFGRLADLPALPCQD